MQVSNVVHHQLDAHQSAVATLLSARLPSVGPKTAANLALQFGTELQSVMDSPEAIKKLVNVKGVGAKSAKKIKEAWDSSRGLLPSLQASEDYESM